MVGGTRGRGWLYGVGPDAVLCRYLELSVHVSGVGELLQHFFPEGHFASQHEALQHCSFENVGGG